MCFCVSECYTRSVGLDSRQSWKPDEGTWSPGAGVTGGRESPRVSSLRTKLRSSASTLHSPTLCYLLMKRVRYKPRPSPAVRRAFLHIYQSRDEASEQWSSSQAVVSPRTSQKTSAVSFPSHTEVKEHSHVCHFVTGNRAQERQVADGNRKDAHRLTLLWTRINRSKQIPTS